MVSYINSLMYKQPQAPPYPGQWFPQNYQTNGSSFLQDSDGLPPQPMYYHPHGPIFQTSPDWQSHENYVHSQNSLLHGSSGAAAAAAAAASLHQSSNNEHLSEGINSIPSPPATLCGSEISSPGAPNGASSPQTHNRPTLNKSPYSWIKKPSYQNQPNPGLINICSAPLLQDFAPLDSSGKTRTKDKYRVVYTDNQRLELEKEFHTARYITIRRKTELAQTLQLSERQVKIWFQNRRAKERKIIKKRDDGSGGSNNCSNMNSSNMLGSNGMMCSSVMNGSPLMLQHGGNNSHNNNNTLSCLVDTKPKLEPGLNLQHPLHQMSAMSMGMNAMNLHHSSLHSHLSVAQPPPPVSAVQHLHQAAQRISSASGGSALSI